MWMEVQKMRFEHRKDVPGEAMLRALRSRFQRIKIQTIGLTGRNIWNFFRIFCPYRSPETRLEVKTNRDSSIQKCRNASLSGVLFLNARIAFLFHFQSRFWRMVWMKNSKKYHKRFSGWDLLFESSYVGICFLGLTKSLLQQRFPMFKSCFFHF